MDHVAPLIQTVLWVALIGAIVWRFNSPLHGLLTALQKRIESGSSIKAGPFELSDQVRPLGITQQVQRTNDEVAELIQAAEINEAVPTPTERAEVKSRFLEAEDLALRAIQVQYGKPISRQLSLGPDLGIDGAFISDGQLNIVEVKYFVRPKPQYDNIRRTLASFQSLFHDNRWRLARIVFAVVIQYPGDMEQVSRDLQNVAKEFDFPVDVHCFSVTELRARFGVLGN